MRKEKERRQTKAAARVCKLKKAKKRKKEMHKEKNSSRKMDYTSREEVLMDKQHAERNGTKQENGGGGEGSALSSEGTRHAGEKNKTD